MSEEAVSVEVEAKTLGWVPKEEWKGAEARWVPAEEFVSRGHTVLPIIRKNNQELLVKLSAKDQEIGELKTALNETQEGVKSLVAFQQAEVKRQVEERVATLRSALREAKKGDDEALVDSIEDSLEAAKDKLKIVAAPPPPAPSPPPAAPKVEPWAKEFAEENKDWFGVDKRKTALFFAESNELHAAGLRGREVLDKAKIEVEKIFAPVPPPNKAEGGRPNGSGGGGGSPAGKSFASLPADAKAVCAAEERKMVGKNKPFKTQAEWHTHYATVYFEKD